MREPNHPLMVWSCQLVRGAQTRRQRIESRRICLDKLPADVDHFGSELLRNKF
jgi:hypothetical protein